MVSFVVSSVQVLDEASYISFQINFLGKIMSPSLLSLAKSKW